MLKLWVNKFCCKIIINQKFRIYESIFMSIIIYSKITLILIFLLTLCGIFTSSIKIEGSK